MVLAMTRFGLKLNPSPPQRRADALLFTPQMRVLIVLGVIILNILVRRQLFHVRNEKNELTCLK